MSGGANSGGGSQFESHKDAKSTKCGAAMQHQSGRMSESGEQGSGGEDAKSTVSTIHKDPNIPRK